MIFWLIQRRFKLKSLIKYLKEEIYLSKKVYKELDKLFDNDLAGENGIMLTKDKKR